mmetsp:Transcript_5783/g.12646  ORF Transcript_5783/g.12646 Transcript_5783/m.12646 type:complete len:245 (-) Transcript_5783:608-1342(-)
MVYPLLRLYLYRPKNRSKLSAFVFSMSLRTLWKPFVSMGVGRRPWAPRMRPTRCVINCESAEYASCSSHDSGIILHPSSSQILKNRSIRSIPSTFASQISLSSKNDDDPPSPSPSPSAPTSFLNNFLLILVFSYTNACPCHPFLAESGPNIGCVAKISHSTGKCSNKIFRGCSLTLATSTTKGRELGPLSCIRFRRCGIRSLTVDSKLTMDTANTITSKSSSTTNLSNSSNFMNLAPISVATSL